MSGVRTILIIKRMLLACCLPLLVFGQEKPSSAPIKLGMSAALSGPSGQLGTQLKQGADAFFDQINAAGGIHGRQISLLARDDQYEPDLTVINTRYFINEAKVDALFSYVGTPTSFAIKPLIETHNIPYITPFTGADILRHQSNIFNLRASYFDEAKVQIDYLIKQKGFKRIAFLIQADEFGLSVNNGLKKAMASYNLSPISIERFKRNSNDLESVLNKLKQVNPEAICLVGTYKPLSTFINLAAKQNFRPQFTTVSFVSSKDLFERINQPSNILVTEVMPSVSICKEPWCHAFRRTMRNKNIHNPTRVHLEGYANAYTFYSAAKKCVHLTQACLLQQLAIIKKRLASQPREFVNKSQYITGNTVFLNHFNYSKDP